MRTKTTLPRALSAALPRALSAALIALTGVLASCTSGDTGSATSPHEKAVAEAWRSALSDTEENDPAVQHEIGQQFMVSCMAEAGFTYRPAPRGRFLWEELGLSDREFTLRYGRGISTLIDFRNAQFHTDDDGGPAIDDTMSESERAAYQRAYERCQREMIAETGVLPEVISLPPGSPLGKAIVEAGTEAAKDPRIAEAVEQWAACMREQGFHFSGPTELTQELHSRVAHLEQAYVSRAGALVDQGRSWKELRVEDVLTEAELAELRTIQTFELSVGAAEVVCADRGIDPRKTEHEVQREYLRKALAEFGS